MNWFILRLCWKNVWRNKRRTFLTVNAIGLGVMALVVLYNYYDGFHEQIIQNVIRYQSGHMMISSPGYPTNASPSRYIHDARKISKWLKKRPEVKAQSERVIAQGLLSSPRGSANIFFTGIDPKKETKVTHFATNLIEGDFLTNEKDKPIVIGKNLARLLKVSVGEKVVALTQGVDGSIGNELFRVSGIFETQSDLDKSLAFIPIKAARSLLSLAPNAVHQISVVLKQEGDLEPVRMLFDKRFPKKTKATPVKLRGNPKDAAELYSWKEIQRPLMAMIELNKSVNRLLMIIILCVAALGIANSILMGIMERTRELGVMMAIGTTKADVIRMVVAETMLLSVVGVVVGNVLGIAATLYFHQYGFDLKWLTTQSIVVQGTIIQTVSYPNVHWNNSALITFSILFLSIIVSLIPVRHIVRLNTVDALKAH